MNLSPAPPTEGVKYIGSKLKLLPGILYLAQKAVGRKAPGRVLDAFSGTTRVSQALAQHGWEVWCNDLAVWSEVFATCYLLNRQSVAYYQSLLDHLNGCQPKDGWFTLMYGGDALAGDGKKRPWQIHVTRKLDAIREEIERLKLAPVEKAVVLTSLMLALDRVDNTLGHFASYLRGWSARSYRPLVLSVPRLLETKANHRVFRLDVFDLLPQAEVDLAYLDPPYGSNNELMPSSRVRYAAYYHLWTTICQFDYPEVFGRSNRRRDTSDRVAGSVFEEYRKDESGIYIAVRAIERLIQEILSPWVILSYSSGGRATAEQLDMILRSHGRIVEVLQMDYRQHVMTGMTSTGEWIRAVEKPHREFLFLLRKN